MSVCQRPLIDAAVDELQRDVCAGTSTTKGAGGRVHLEPSDEAGSIETPVANGRDEIAESPKAIWATQQTMEGAVEPLSAQGDAGSMKTAPNDLRSLQGSVSVCDGVADGTRPQAEQSVNEQGACYDASTTHAAVEEACPQPTRNAAGQATLLFTPVPLVDRMCSPEPAQPGSPPIATLLRFADFSPEPPSTPPSLGPEENLSMGGAVFKGVSAGFGGRASSETRASLAAAPAETFTSSPSSEPMFTPALHLGRPASASSSLCGSRHHRDTPAAFASRPSSAGSWGAAAHGPAAGVGHVAAEQTQASDTPRSERGGFALGARRSSSELSSPWWDSEGIAVDDGCSSGGSCPGSAVPRLLQQMPKSAHLACWQDLA
jgi:hypothetical protein